MERDSSLEFLPCLPHRELGAVSGISSKLPLLGCFFTVSETRPKQAAVLREASLQLFDFSHRRCYSVTRSALPGSPNPFFPAHVHHGMRPHFLLHCDWLVCTPFFGLLEYRLGRIWFGVLNCSRVPDTGKVNKTSDATGLSHAHPVSRLSGCDSPPWMCLSTGLHRQERTTVDSPSHGFIFHVFSYSGTNTIQKYKQLILEVSISHVWPKQFPTPRAMVLTVNLPQPGKSESKDLPRSGWPVSDYFIGFLRQGLTM